MPGILAVSLRIIPANLRDKYVEIWSADILSSEEADNQNFSTQLQFLALCLRLRWQADSFILGRLATRTLMGLFFGVLYAQFAQVRDILVLFVVWWLIKRSDFRAVHSRRALKATSIHLCVSTLAYLFGLLVYASRGYKILARDLGWQTLESVGYAFLAASLISAMTAVLIWLIDFLFTSNVLATGKLFSLLAVALLSIQWLQQSRNISELLNPSAWLSNVLVPVSKIQQLTTNLVVPLLFCFIAVTAVTNYRARKAFGKTGRSS